MADGSGGTAGDGDMADGSGGTAGDGDMADGAAPVMQFRVMEVVGLTVDLPSQFPLLTLQEAEPPFRQLTIPLGMAEGVAMGHALHKVATPRPLTHELFVSVLLRLNVDVVAIRLVGRTAGTYLGELDLIGPRGREVVPCRPSDGLTMAMRLPVAAPVLADERLLDADGDVTPG